MLAAIIIIRTWLGRYDDADAAYESILAMGMAPHVLPGIRLPSLVFRNRNDDALELFETVLKNESGSAQLFYRFAFAGLAHYNMSGYDKALRYAQNALEVGREFFLSHLVRIAALQRLGRHEDAAAALEEMQLDYRDPTVSEFDFLPFTDEARKRALLDALRDAGMPE